MSRIAVIAPSLKRNAFYTPWQFAGALQKRHDAIIIGPGRKEDLWSPAKWTSLAIHFIEESSRDARPELLAALRSIDLLYVFGATSWTGLALWARRRTGIPVVVHLDDWEGGYFSDRPLFRRLWYVLRAPRNNEVIQRYWESRTAAADEITVSSRALQRRFGGSIVRQGVDTDRYSPANYPRGEARRRLGIRHDERIVLFLGTPAQHKGLEDLLAVFRSIRVPDARLWIVGRSPDEVYQRRLESGAPENVSFLPNLPMDEATWYMSACDVFVVPQRPIAFAMHQIPAKIIHAMAAGACVVGTDVGDISDLLRDGAGIVIPPSDPSSLLEAIRTLLSDEGLRSATGSRARTRAVEHYGWDAMSRQLEELVQRLPRVARHK